MISATTGNTVGIAPRRNRPINPCFSLPRSWGQAFAFGQNALGVFENRVAFLGEAIETVAALDDGRTQLVLKLPDRRGQSRLRYVAAFGRAGEVLLARQGDKILKLPQNHPNRNPY